MRSLGCPFCENYFDVYCAYGNVDKLVTCSQCNSVSILRYDHSWNDMNEDVDEWYWLEGCRDQSILPIEHYLYHE